MTKREIVQLPCQVRAARVDSATYNADENTIECVWTSGQDVVWTDSKGAPYIERLMTGTENVRLDRLNAGAPLLDAHNSYALGAVVGSVVPGSARMDGGLGIATVKLSQSARAADTVRDIRDGIIRNISVGYAVHTFERSEPKDGSPAIMTATDWEPLEISAVPVPADARSQFRAHSGDAELNNCTIIRSTTEEAVLAENELETVETAKPEVDVKLAIAEAVAAERSRTNDIMTLARSYGLEDLGNEHCARGSSIQDVKDVILEKLKSRNAAAPVANVAVDGLKAVVTDERSLGEAWARTILKK
jgi:hypothetical protein